MDNMNGIMDVSCFLLVEASGDSELDCEQSSIKQCQSMDMATATATAAFAAAVLADENDAESCSCDTISTERLDDFYELILQLDDDHPDDDDDDQDLIDCNVWSIDEALGYISADHHEMKVHQEPNTSGVDLCREVIDGMEDRLFWETCMAVGYP